MHLHKKHNHYPNLQDIKATTMLELIANGTCQNMYQQVNKN